MVRLHPFPGIEIVYSERTDGSIDSGEALRDFFTQKIEKKLSPVVLGLVHGTSIVEATRHESVIDEVDAVYTTQKQLPLSLRMADCLPIVFVDAKHGAIMLVHGSRESLRKGIVDKALRELQSQFETDLTKLNVWIGPSIGACCNRLKNFTSFASKPAWKPYLSKLKDGTHLDLQQFVVDFLVKKGVEKGHIIDEKLCTYHLDKRFFSHRRATEKASPKDDGRMLVAVWRTSEK